MPCGNFSSDLSACFSPPLPDFDAVDRAGLALAPVIGGSLGSDADWAAFVVMLAVAAALTLTDDRSCCSSTGVSAAAEKLAAATVRCSAVARPDHLPPGMQR